MGSFSGSDKSPMKRSLYLAKSMAGAEVSSPSFGTDKPSHGLQLSLSWFLLHDADFLLFFLFSFDCSHDTLPIVATQ
jgi:hypothetical protein